MEPRLFDFMTVTKALADETRVRILMALIGRELCVCQVIDLFGLSPSTVSRHLSILRHARLVSGRKSGRWMYYRHADDQVPAMAAQAVAWTVRFLEDDPVIRQDQHLLEEMLAQDTGAGCTP